MPSLRLTSFRLPSLWLPCALAGVVLLSACGDSKGPKATQVAAKVGGEEITVHQINNVLARSNLPAGTDAKAAAREALERLIEQQLAINAAVEKKLHRDPAVVASIEDARREIVARAYVQQVAQAVAKPTPEDIKRYFDDNPALFTQRRLYNLQELVVPKADKAVKDRLDGAARSSEPLEKVAEWLNKQDVTFRPGSAVRGAEQIPVAVLPQIAALKDGQNTLLTNADSATIVRVVASRSVPVNFEQAKDAIERYLTNERVKETLDAQRKRMRRETEIAFQGEFEGMAASFAAASGGTAPAAGAAASSKEAASAPTAAAPAAQATTLTAETPVAAASQPKKSAVPEAIERGITGGRR